MSVASYIPSPSHGVWDIGPVPLRAYALCIIIGACRHHDRRATVPGARRREPGLSAMSRSGPSRSASSGRGSTTSRPTPSSTSVTAAPGQRAQIWEGGLGIWGAVAGGRWAAASPAVAVGSVLVAGGAVAPGLAGRTSDRPHRQLLQPGAVRQADDPAVGSGDRRGPPPGRVTRSSRRSTPPSSTS